MLRPRARVLHFILLALLAACGQRVSADAPVAPPAPPPAAATAGDTAPAYVYPTTRAGDQVDVYHGISVPDPYRWLEDLDAEETKTWVAAQNELTFGELAKITERSAIADKLARLWNYERVGLPDEHGGKYFFDKNDGLQDQDVLYVSEGLTGQAKILLDPNTLSSDGTVALSGTEVSDDGKYLAYGVSASGSDWQTWRVRDVATGQDLPDKLEWIKFSRAAWTSDGKGFFYSRYAAPAAGETFEGVNYNQKLYYHAVGTPQTADELVYERPDHKEWGFRATVSQDGRYLILGVSEGTDRRDRVYYRDLKRKRARTRPDYCRSCL